VNLHVESTVKRVIAGPLEDGGGFAAYEGTAVNNIAITSKSGATSARHLRILIDRTGVRVNEKVPKWIFKVFSLFFFLYFGFRFFNSALFVSLIDPVLFSFYSVACAQERLTSAYKLLYPYKIKNRPFQSVSLLAPFHPSDHTEMKDQSYLTFQWNIKIIRS
jgi:hypothetical protein